MVLLNIEGAMAVQQSSGVRTCIMCKSLSDTRANTDISTFICISLDISTFIFSLYLPTRAGCTDSFKEALDTLQAIKEKLNPSCLAPCPNRSCHTISHEAHSSARLMGQHTADARPMPMTWLHHWLGELLECWQEERRRNHYGNSQCLLWSSNQCLLVCTVVRQVVLLSSA